MGSYTFTWEHSGNEVFVTGDFDDWKQTVKLEKENGVFKKTVDLPKSKTQYKFIVDGSWVTNESAPKEDDGKGNYNNVLKPEDIKEEPISTLSSAAPESTTAALAGEVPKEGKSKSEESVPGAFPQTPAETPATEPQTLSINPIPATDGPGNPIKLAAGEKVPDPSTLTSNTIQSTVKGDKEPEEEEMVSVAPKPATAGPGNPIHLEPGEKVPDPSTLTSNTISSTAKTDAASYEKSDAQPPQLAPVVLTPEAEREAKGGMFGIPPVTSGLIPESSLPNDTNVEVEKDPGVAIQSAAPTSTTAALAGEVPKEPKAVPGAVAESQKEADFAPEASGNPEAVQEKKEVEQELKSKVPEEPPAAESPTATEKVAAAAAGGAIAAAGAFAASTYSAKEKAAETIGLNGQATAGEVPGIVSESQKEAHASPEASANQEAVQEKKEVESELLKEVKKANEAGEPAPTATASTSETAPGLAQDALADKKPLESSSESDALNAPAAKPAEPETPAKPAADSRDISPMSKQPTTTEQSQPTVTTGVETSKTEAKTTPAPETPKKETAESAKGTPDSVASGATDKKKKRRSIFGKLKDKLHI
ncbi:carbohydrate-binding module family 48 protein [Zopfia rhizophila CBS 207.26]|uniref:Carbohydrate-binding module family 48 protein n=1 Tax=Zopfia rhizophila CBS 207.26 TaxID=1314779 RepID=A0A6A6E5B7_9PEZI|nr:carbohydrate-binding module family 48 protein [Zopfia rhizophila CBS 207.26]